MESSVPHSHPSHPLVRTGQAHLPALDGVRGLAILMVLFFHFTQLWKDCKFDAAFGALTRFGWVGVDLFFVLSGFLITGILLDGRGQKHYFRNFYARRVLRIFPLYYIIVAFGTLIVPLLSINSQLNFQSVEKANLPFYWLYFSNFGIVFGKHDFQNDVLAITWSLAIEEQFYMIWPLVVWMCKPATIKKICFGLLGLSFLTRVGVAYMIHKSGNLDLHRIAYEFTPCRMDAIALGSFLAVRMFEGGIPALKSLLPSTRWLAPLAGIIILVCFAYQKKTIFNEGGLGQTIGYTAIAIFFACLMVWTLTNAGGGLFSWFFTQRWLTFLGRYSYAIYLFHMPITRVMREYIYNPRDFLMIGHEGHGTRMPGQLIFYVLCLVPTLAMAMFSWEMVEKHFLKLKKHFPTHHPREITPTKAELQPAT